MNPHLIRFVHGISCAIPTYFASVHESFEFRYGTLFGTSLKCGVIIYVTYRSLGLLRLTALKTLDNNLIIENLSDLV